MEIRWKRREQQPIEVKSAVHSIVSLKPKDQYICPTCSGTGSYLEQADAHRSEGWIPCPSLHCRGGVIVSKTVVVSKPVYRVKAGRNKLD